MRTTVRGVLFARKKAWFNTVIISTGKAYLSTYLHMPTARTLQWYPSDQGARPHLVFEDGVLLEELEGRHVARLPRPLVPNLHAGTYLEGLGLHTRQPGGETSTCSGGELKAR